MSFVNCILKMFDLNIMRHNDEHYDSRKNRQTSS